MKAQLADGTVIELAKDCDCITHAGPHWLYADALAKAENDRFAAVVERMLGDARTIMAASLAMAAANKHAGYELARLQEKEREMQRRGIVRLIEEAQP